MAKEPIIEQETRLSALINGQNTAGMLVLHKAVQMATERAQAHGFGIVGTHHTATSTGAIGYYADLIGQKGLIGMVLAQSPEFVAPHGECIEGWCLLRRWGAGESPGCEPFNGNKGEIIRRLNCGYLVSCDSPSVLRLKAGHLWDKSHRPLDPISRGSCHHGHGHSRICLVWGAGG